MSTFLHVDVIWAMEAREFQNMPPVAHVCASSLTSAAILPRIWMMSCSSSGLPGL